MHSKKSINQLDRVKFHIIQRKQETTLPSN